ncbi:unnamed protein product [Haemonchus placei]|uniref:Uncharacterized protein n=1 Tax=Haemonchus placei TaxID=6290 RepID=A0A0N4WFF0_HAEPC|nr:unnamed protein product [Haemonchus placei]
MTILLLKTVNGDLPCRKSLRLLTSFTKVEGTIQ